MPSVQVTTDWAEIQYLLGQQVSADPVGNTVLGSVQGELADHPTGWCAWLPTATDIAVAARSAPPGPVALSPGWDSHTDQLATALAALPDLVGIGGPATVVDDLAARVAERGGRAVAHRTDEMLYRCDELTEPELAGSGRDADAGDEALLLDWYEQFLLGSYGYLPSGADTRLHAAAWFAAHPPALWTDADGRPMAMAAWRLTGSGVGRIGPVYTPVELRGRGAASGATARATRAVHDRGAIPTLYTDITNATSNPLYQRLGYTQVGGRAAVFFN